MKYSEFKRRLEKQGAKLKLGKGNHLRVELKAEYSVLACNGGREIPE